MAEKKKMSVAEILAAARKADSGGAEQPPSEPAATAEETAAAPEKVASAAPEKEAVKPKPGERPSVADMLAMARSGKQGAEQTAAAKTPETAKPKPAAKPAAKKAATAKPATTERLDTTSILAAARGSAKRGPVSKADAPSLPAAKTKPKAKTTAKRPLPTMPEKPAYAAPAKKSAQPDKGRRVMVLGAVFGSFLAAGMTFLTTTIGLWTLAVARFMFPNILTEPPSRFKIGFPDSIPPGTVETKFKAQFGVWVVNYEYQGQRAIYALSTVCTHLGCTPNWLDAEQKFKCPCHGSGFYKDGINFEGPAPRPLERYAIRIGDDGQIEIDKSRKFQEELGQWADPASFVPV